MTINYTQLVASLENLLQEDAATVDGAFNSILPQIIDDAEQRIYRELNFIAQRSQNTSVTTTTGSRVLSLSATTLPCVTVEQVSVSGIPFEGPTSLDWVSVYWPNSASTSAPGTTRGYWAMLDNQTVILAPTPDSSYPTVVTGIFRPSPMSASNTTTYLGTYYSDLFLAACMVFGCAYQRDFSAVNPQDKEMAVTWEAFYQARKQSAIDEEARRRGESVGWTPMKQFEGTPPRT